MSENNQMEIASMKRVLHELSEMAEHASLTGALSGGEGRAVSRYNAILARLAEFQEIPTGFFQPLPAGSGYGDLAVESRLLAAHLDEASNHVYGKQKHKNKQVFGNDPSVLIRLAPFVDSQDLAQLVRDMMKQNANIDMNVLTALAPFMDRGLLGELLRKTAWSEEAPAAPEPPEAPEPASAPAPEPAPAATPGTTHTWDDRLTATPDSQPAKAEDLLELLKNPHLTEGERSELIQRLAESVAPK